MSGFGLKNSFSIGCSSLRRHRMRRAVRFEQRVRPRTRSSAAPAARRPAAPCELIEQIGSDAARIEELLELHRRQLADLLLGVVDAALLADARADLLHDLLDIDRVGADVEIGHKQLSAFSRRRSIGHAWLVDDQGHGQRPQRHAREQRAIGQEQVGRAAAAVAPVHQIQVPENPVQRERESSSPSQGVPNFSCVSGLIV